MGHDATGSASEVRSMLLAILVEQCDREANAGYDQKTGLAACANVYVGLESTVLSNSAQQEARNLLGMLKIVQYHSRETLQGESSTGAATVGSIVRRFRTALLSQPWGKEVDG
jgi:hypothetical protein